MTFYEGETVSFIGEERNGYSLGSHGRLLRFAAARSGEPSGTPEAGHVQWTDGPLRGRVDLIELEDLAPAARRYTASLDGLEDSLEVGPVSLRDTRYVFEVEGSRGVLTRLASTGKLVSFDEIADEVISFVEGKIRSQAAINTELEGLEDHEASEVVRLGALVLLRDAFGNDEVSGDG